MIIVAAGGGVRSVERRLPRQRRSHGRCDLRDRAVARARCVHDRANPRDQRLRCAHPVARYSQRTRCRHRRCRGAAITAERTLSFIGLKLGFYLGEGPNYTGIVLFDDLDLPAGASEFVPPSALRIDEDFVAHLLPRRRRTAHKGQQGSVLVIGGGVGMAGAARMAGEAALRAGAGARHSRHCPENVASITASRPELMCHGVEGASDLHGDDRARRRARDRAGTGAERLEQGIARRRRCK